MTERQLRNKIEKLVAYQFQGDPEVKHVINAQEIYDILSEYIAKHDRELVEKVLEEIEEYVGTLDREEIEVNEEYATIKSSFTVKELKDSIRSKFLGGE